MGLGQLAGDRQSQTPPRAARSAPAVAGAEDPLTVARELAEAHGGRLTLDSVGAGAAFRLALPLREAGRDSRGAA